LGFTDRLVLKDEQWARISGLIIGRPDQRGSTGRDNRMFVEGVLWIVRTAAPWRICRKSSESGTVFFAASAAGARKAFGSVSSKPCRMTQISST
jgi:transposase